MTSYKHSDNTDIFLNQLIQFYSNNAFSSTLNCTQYAALPHSIEIVMWPQITVTSPHIMYSLFLHWILFLCRVLLMYWTVSCKVSRCRALTLFCHREFSV